MIMTHLPAASPLFVHAMRKPEGDDLTAPPANDGAGLDLEEP